MGPLIALIDGPLGQDHPALEGTTAGMTPGARHAAAVARAILMGCPQARFLSLPVFGARLVTDAPALARALEAAGAAQLVHCSLGLPRPDAEVGRAVEALIAARRVVVAAAPARGGPVWPAAWAGVVSVQGDARCGPADWSVLDLPGAVFGACPRLQGEPGVAGASVAAGHLTGLLAARLRETTPEMAIAALRSEARFTGREHRR